MAAPDRPSRSPLALRLALFVGVGLLVGEVALRVLDLFQGRSPFSALMSDQDSLSPRYQPHPFMGFSLKPGHVGEGVNLLGMRGPMTTRVKPEGVFRILCVGGSTTYGSGIPADKAYPARLQALLQDAQTHDPSVTFEVLNCGVPGYTTAESLINLALRLTEFKADALIIYHAINDARLIQIGGFQADYSHMRSSWKRPVISPIEWSLLRHCRLFFHLFHEHYVAPHETRLEHLIYVDPDTHPHPEPSWTGVNPKGLATYVRNLRTLLAVAEEHGIAAVLTTFAASKERLVGPGYDDVLTAMNRQVRRLAQQRDLPLIELAGPLSQNAEFFTDYVHLSEAGCQAQARQIFRQAKAQGLWHLR